MLLKVRIYLFAFLAALSLPMFSVAQTTTPGDSIPVDSVSDLGRRDSVTSDTSIVKRKNENEFKSKIDYSAKDSLSYSADHKKAYLYGDAKVTYEDIELTAAYIEYDFTNNEVKASPLKDSVGNPIGLPNFKQGDNTFKSNNLTYNFKTKKGIIYQINTEQEGGFLHAEKTKKQADGSIDIKKGIYTTCDAPHPHFGLVLTKGKVLPDDKIVSGPAYMVFEDVPLPLGLPFGFFPNSKKSVSGIIMPAYGESASEGFYLRDGGYYFAASDYFDLTLTGNIYSKGSWGSRARSMYTKRYKFNGSFDFNYNVTKQGIIGIDSGSNQFSKQTYMSINWNHAQAATANPNQTFSANVNYSTSGYDRRFNYYGSQGINNLMQTSKSSSISYSRRWENANLSVNLRHNQVNTTKEVTFGLPSVAFNVNRIYLFRKKNSTGLKWYENISLSYSSRLENTFRSNEDEIFSKKTLEAAQNGFMHTIPFSTNVKFLKYFNFSPSLTYNGMLYTTQTSKKLETVFNANTNKYEKQIVIDTLHKVSYAQGFSPSASLSVNPTIYGMFQFGPRSKVNAIRHVITPSLGFSFVPEIKSLIPDYYEMVADSIGKEQEYSIYERNIFGTPSVPRRSAGISLNIGNNVEMKVKSAKDTVTGLRKIVLIQSFNLSTSYNPYATERKLSAISMTGTSPILKNLVINYNGTIDPYALDSLGRSTSTYYWKKHRGIGRLTNAGLSFGYNFSSAGGSTSQDNNQNNGNTPQGQEGANQNPAQPQKPRDDFAYFKVPWSFSFNYNLSYTKYGFEKNIIQSLTFNGNVNLTNKWAITFNSGYDFKAKDFSVTSFSITRNLHCWTMSINFIPFGPYRYYEFRISALSQFLRDLKYEQRRDYYDNYDYRGF